MTDQTNMKTLPPLRETAYTENESTDGGFNRRLGLGLVLSVGANVLLLQGAGMMKNQMNIAPHTDPISVINVVRTSSKPTPSPIATPSPAVKKPAIKTPAPIPTPTPVDTPEPTPTPTPKLEPTPIPKPKPVKPTPAPTPTPVTPTVQPIANPVRSTTPSVTPPKNTAPSISSPKNLVTQPEAPATELSLATHEVSPRANRQPSISAPTAAKIIGMTTPRENTPAADTSFVVDAGQIAPAHSVADLPRPSLVGQISAAIGNATNVKVQASAALNVVSSTNDRVPGALRSSANRTISAPGKNTSFGSRTADGPTNFSMTPGGQNMSGGVHGAINAATHGSPAGPYAPSAAGPTGLHGGDDQMGVVTPGAGSGRGAQPRLSGRRGAPHGGGAIGSDVATDLRAGSDGPGAPGFADGVDGGKGKHPGFETGIRTGGPVDGFNGGKGVDGIKPGSGGGPAISDSGPTKRVSGPALTTSGDVSASKDPGTGSAVNAVYKDPSTISIAVPEDLRSKAYDVTVTVRVVFQADGQVRVDITKESGYPALDTQVKTLCSNIKFKPAMLDGKAVNETRTFNFHLRNGD